MSTAQDPPQTNRLLRLREVRERLGVSERTLRSWIAAGWIRVVRLSSRALRIEGAELERFIRERRASGAA